MRTYLAILALGLSFSAVAGNGPGKIKIDTGVELFTDKTTEPSALAVSEDGSRIYWIAKKSKHSLLQPIDVWHSSTNEANPVRITRRGGDIYSAVSPVVGTDDEIVTNHEIHGFGAVIRTIIHQLIHKDDTPQGYKSCIDFRNTMTNKSTKLLCAKELGIKEEMLDHARLSPDKNWLTFYLKGASNPAGIYLHNMNTGKTSLLGEFDDKHPTWTPDGTRIMFHFQRGGNVKTEADTEEAFIGWYNLKFNGDEIVSAERHLIDNPKLVTAYTYQKHPTMIPGTNYIVYHGQEKVDGSKKLYIRELKADSKVKELSMKLNDDCSIKSTKHAAAGFHDHYLYFVAKSECKEGDKEVKSASAIYRVDIDTFVGKLK